MFYIYSFYIEEKYRGKMKLEILKYDYYDKTKRNLYILTPEKFDTGKLYKTLYMFDGESTFLKSEYTNENWGVKETFENLDIKDWIVVGLDNAGKYRMNEYLPYSISHHGKTFQSLHKDFDNFFLENVIPFIEQKYPVYKNSEYRALAGSSLGGFLTVAFAGKYNNIFSKFGIFSLASWITHDDKFINEFLEENPLHQNNKFFVYVGDREGYDNKLDIETKKVTDSYLNESYNLINYFNEKNINCYKFIVGKNETHSEISWKKYFPEFVKYILN